MGHDYPAAAHISRWEWAALIGTLGAAALGLAGLAWLVIWVILRWIER